MAFTLPTMSPKRHAIPIVTILACACIGAVSAAQLAHAKLISKNNLFSLVGGLDVTTSQILDNTRGLKTQVNQVEQQLGTLQQQEQILSQQQRTGASLANQLGTQAHLTQQNVALMSQILGAEQRTSTQAARVQAQSQALAQKIGTNASVLSGLANTLDKTNRESTALNGQMDSLLGELQNAEQEFRLFGQVDSLLGKGGLVGGITGLAGNTASGLTSTLGGVTKSVGGVTKSVTGSGGLLDQLTNPSSKSHGSGTSKQTGQSNSSTSSSGTPSESGGGLLGLGILG